MAVEGKLNVVFVREYEVKGEKKKQWNNVGVAFPNKLGGYNIRMNVPIAAMELILMPPKDDEKKDDPF